MFLLLPLRSRRFVRNLPQQRRIYCVAFCFKARDTFLMSSTLHFSEMKNISPRYLLLNFFVSLLIYFYVLCFLSCFFPLQRTTILPILLLSRFYVNQFNFHFIVMPREGRCCLNIDEVGKGAKVTNVSRQAFACFLVHHELMVACNIYTR